MRTRKEWSMDVKERRPYCSLTKSRRDKERRYTNSSAENEECRVPTQKSYSSSETLKAFDHDSSRLLYGNRVKDLVHREADEYTRQGRQEVFIQLECIIHLYSSNKAFLLWEEDVIIPVLTVLVILCTNSTLHLCLPKYFTKMRGHYVPSLK